MKKLLAITILLLASTFALAQNECPAGTYVPSWGKFTTSDGVTHQTVCIDTSARWTLPLFASFSPSSMTLPAGTFASPTLNFSGLNSPAMFNDTTFSGLGIIYGGATRLYIGNAGLYLGAGVYSGASSIGSAPDVGISRCAAGKYCLGNGTAADATGTWNAAEYQVGGVASSGTGGIARTTSPVITSPQFVSGITSNTGFDKKRQASCTTTAVANGTCIGTVNWTVTFADTNYTAICIEDTPVTGNTWVIGTLTKTTTSIQYVLENVPGNTSASTATINCIAVHD